MLASGFGLTLEANLQMALARPANDTIARGAARSGFDDETEDEFLRPLTAEEAQALRLKNPQVSPWRVVGAQAVLGVVIAMLAVGLVGWAAVGWSALYGVAVVVVPGALMARGVTRRLPGVSPIGSAVSVMSWSVVKIGVSVFMLLLAPRVLHPLSWPALLATMVACMQVYWVALLWRRR
jgi:ATP synthase protein I